MKLVEMGEIGSCFGEDLFTDLCERVEKEGGWNIYEVGKQIQKHLVELCRDRLPERGLTIEATEDEIRGLEFNPFAGEITIVPKEGNGGEEETMAKEKPVIPRKRFCDEDCNNCDIPHNRQFSLLVNVMVEAFGEDEVYPIVQTLCPNMTCCADCHIDDFCHDRGCEIYKEARRLGKAWMSKGAKLRTVLRRMVDWWDEGGLDEEDMDKMDAMIDEANAILGDEPDDGKEQQ